MVSKFGKNAPSRVSTLYPVPAEPSHQERVYAEMFRAIELLGRKLERAEHERERLTRRLALIESSATVDEKTGRLYLPVALDPAMPLPRHAAPAPRWAMGLSLASVTVACFSLGLVLFQKPVQTLTPQQIAALDAIVSTRVATLDEHRWQEVQPPEAIAENVTSPATEEVTASQIADETHMASIAQEMAAIEPAIGDAGAPVAQDQMSVLPSSPVVVQKPAQPAAEAVAEDQPASAAKETPAVESASPAVTEKRAPVAVKKDIPAGAAAVYSDIGGDPELPPKLAKLERRAFDGVGEAQHDLATIYASGKLVPQDYKRAVYWFSKSADAGVANAHYNLGVMFQQGLGVRKDMKKAIRWYQSAAELGHPEAMYNLGIAYIEGVGTKRNIERGASYFKRAANAGVTQAAYNLGVLYESSFIGAVDVDKALEWYRVAAGEGHKDASVAARRLERQQAAATTPGRTSRTE